MKSFLRSLRYLRPYRARLAVSVACVLLIAVLWGGGLGILLPGMKVLISEEGLHGWAWNSQTSDRIGARMVHRKVPPGLQREHDLPAIVLDAVALDTDGPAARGGLKENDWIAGLDDTEPAHRRMRADVLARRLALTEAASRVRLRVFNSYDETFRTVEVELDVVGFGTAVLGRVAKSVPEPATRPERFNMLLWVAVIGAGITLLRDLMRFFQEYLVQSAVFSGIMDFRCENYDISLRLPLTFFSEKGATDTMSRFVADTDEVTRGQVTLFGKTLVEPAKAVASLAMAMLFSWQLTLLALVAGPPAFVLVRKFGKRMRRASRRALESRSEMLGVLEETLTGIGVVKAYTMEASERRRFAGVNRRLLRQQKRMAAIDAATAPSVEALGVTGGMVAVALAGYFVLQGKMDGEYFIAWMGCLVAMFDAVRKLAKVPTRFQRADAAAQRVFELHDREQEKSLPGAPMLPPHTESLRFNHATFRYPSASEDALKDINLEVASGETVAIVGPNGSGKTTLVRMLPRLLEPSKGAILIDGKDIREFSLRSLRRQIGIVTQDTVLFHTTIGENIAYGLRRPHQEQVLDAARKAFVDEFVRDLPDGYDTMVGEHGATLSGGQRQRIAIARAIIRDPAILIFDEAMSQVDADSERRIHQAMEQFIKDRTTLMIAHRFATVLSADRIVVMDAGCIVDTGTHEELLGRCKLYHHLYKTQFVDSGG